MHSSFIWSGIVIICNETDTEFMHNEDDQNSKPSHCGKHRKYVHCAHHVSSRLGEHFSYTNCVYQQVHIGSKILNHVLPNAV